MSSAFIYIHDIRENKIALRTVDRQSDAYKRLYISMQRRGLSNPLTVRKDVDYEGIDYYELVDGLHRFIVCREMGFRHIKCIVVKLNDEDCLFAQIQLQKNNKWIPTTDDDYSRQLRRILTRCPLMILREMATRCDKNGAWVKRILLGSRLKSHIYNQVFIGRIGLMNAYALSKLPKTEQSNWEDRAKIMRPQEFIPLSNERVQEIETCKAAEKLQNVFTTLPKINTDIKISAEGVKESIEKMKEAFAKALDYKETDAHELLHGPKIDYELIRHKGESIQHWVKIANAAIIRKGWDNIVVGGKPSYCYGDILIQWTGKCWTIYHPVFKTLANESYVTALAAMKIVEENL